jgi:hypothetical protein
VLDEFLDQPPQMALAEDDEVIQALVLYRLHKSLSKLAKMITGTGWNGHLFFGTQRRMRGRSIHRRRNRRMRTASTCSGKKSQGKHWKIVDDLGELAARAL